MITFSVGNFINDFFLTTRIREEVSSYKPNKNYKWPCFLNSSKTSREGLLDPTVAGTYNIILHIILQIHSAQNCFSNGWTATSLKKPLFIFFLLLVFVVSVFFSVYGFSNVFFLCFLLIVCLFFPFLFFLLFSCLIFLDFFLLFLFSVFFSFFVFLFFPFFLVFWFFFYVYVFWLLLFLLSLF